LALDAATRAVAGVVAVKAVLLLGVAGTLVIRRAQQMYFPGKSLLVDEHPVFVIENVDEKNKHNVYGNGCPVPKELSLKKYHVLVRSFKIAVMKLRRSIDGSLRWQSRHHC
jgi:hypothetical protein